MPIAECRMLNEKRIGLRPQRLREPASADLRARCRAAGSAIFRSFPIRLHNSAIGNRQSAFTLIELLVSVGLMAILFAMIAVIFFEATQAFRVARASIEIHESARSALNALVNDLTAAEFSAYDNGVQGYFALSQGPTDPTLGSCPPTQTPPWNTATAYTVNDIVIWSGSSYICIAANPSPSQSPPDATHWRLIGAWVPPVGANGNQTAVDTLTFTTLAPQPSARYAAPEAVQQLALVRYALEWDGGNATVPGSRTPRPTYNLVKRVRFPSTNDPNLNMDIFDWDLRNPVTNLPYLQTEYTLHTSPPTDPDVIRDAAGLRYAQSEVIAFHVLSMNVRLLCLPEKQTPETSAAFVEAGTATSPSPIGSSTLTDSTKNWSVGAFSAGGFALRIVAGAGAGQALPISSATASDTLTCSGTWTAALDRDSQYRIEELDTIPNTGTGAVASAGNSPPTTYITDDGTTGSKNWLPGSSFSVSGGEYYTLQIVSGLGAGQALPISGASAPDTVTCSAPWTTVPDITSRYLIIPPAWNLAWYQRGNNDFFGPTYRPPSIVEVTLEMTDARATRSFIFTQRFYIPASER